MRTSEKLTCRESRTGKESVARTVHKFSHRSPWPFVRVNCAANPPLRMAPGYSVSREVAGLPGRNHVPAASN